MVGWTGWVAAIGGLISLIGIGYGPAWVDWLGGILALVFGIWAAMAK